MMKKIICFIGMQRAVFLKLELHFCFNWTEINDFSTAKINESLAGSKISDVRGYESQ